jgi:hypothetical protein
MPSVFPSRVAQRSAIQLRSLQSPLGQEAIHQLRKPVIVVALEQMRHLMHDDILKTIAVPIS